MEPQDNPGENKPVQTVQNFLVPASFKADQHQKAFMSEAIPAHSDKMVASSTMIQRVIIDENKHRGIKLTADIQKRAPKSEIKACPEQRKPSYRNSLGEKIHPSPIIDQTPMQSAQTMEMTPKTAPGLNFWADKIAQNSSQNADPSNNCRSKKFDLKDQILLLDKQRPQITPETDNNPMNVVNLSDQTGQQKVEQALPERFDRGPDQLSMHHQPKNLRPNHQDSNENLHMLKKIRQDQHHQ